MCYAEAFAVCENYSPPEGFSPKDLHHLLEKVGSPSGANDLGNTRCPIVNLCSTASFIYKIAGDA